MKIVSRKTVDGTWRRRQNRRIRGRQRATGSRMDRQRNRTNPQRGRRGVSRHRHHVSSQRAITLARRGHDQCQPAVSARRRHQILRTQEIKDALAYLQAIVNPADNVNVRRILNVPKRGLGVRAEGLVASYADAHGTTFSKRSNIWNRSKACPRARRNR